MYAGTDASAPKQRVTVYLRKPDADAPSRLPLRAAGRLGMFYWVEAGAGYALVGALPQGAAAGAGPGDLQAATGTDACERGGTLTTLDHVRLEFAAQDVSASRRPA